MITKKFCPNCGSDSIESTGSEGYMCADCGYTGSFPERPVVGSQIDNDELDPSEIKELTAKDFEDEDDEGMVVKKKAKTKAKPGKVKAVKKKGSKK